MISWPYPIVDLWYEPQVVPGGFAVAASEKAPDPPDRWCGRLTRSVLVTVCDTSFTPTHNSINFHDETTALSPAIQCIDRALALQPMLNSHREADVKAHPVRSGFKL